MQKVFPSLVVTGLVITMGWLVWGSINSNAVPALGSASSTVATTSVEGVPEQKPVSYECNMDGKVCEDGSVVGRTGPLCEFAACPPADARSATIKTTIGQKMTALGVTITPRDVVDDSRCPSDVQCIWAGTAHVKSTVSTSAGSTDVVFELGHPETVGGYMITLTELTPGKQSGEEIPDSAYRFVFTISKK